MAGGSCGLSKGLRLFADDTLALVGNVDLDLIGPPVCLSLCVTDLVGGFTHKRWRSCVLVGCLKLGIHVVNCQLRRIIRTIRLCDFQDFGFDFDRPVYNLARAAMDDKLAVSHNTVVSIADLDLQCFAHVHCCGDTKPTFAICKEDAWIALADGSVISILDVSSATWLHHFDLSNDYMAEFCLKWTNSGGAVVASYQKDNPDRGLLRKV